MYNKSPTNSPDVFHVIPNDKIQMKTQQGKDFLISLSRICDNQQMSEEHCLKVYT